MEKIIVHSLFVIVLIALCILVNRYWNKQIVKKFQFQEINAGYSLFISGQFIALCIALFTALDVQGLTFLESMEPFGRDFQIYWSVFGVLTVSILFVYAISTLIAILVHKGSLPGKKDWQEEINDNNWAAILPIVTLTILLTASFSYFVVRPYIFDWISGSVGFVPLN
jgi:hypothetical protein